VGKPNFIYIGPNIPQIGLKRNTIYRGNEPPAKLKELMKQKRVLGSLFVPTAALAQAERNLNIKGSLEHTARKEMEELVKALPH
jgi:hypothetical protein